VVIDSTLRVGKTGERSDDALLDEAPPASTLQAVSAISFEPRSLAGRHQAVGPWCLLTQDIATSLKGLFPWRTKNRANRRTAPIP
jgi:hypothetical protein